MKPILCLDFDGVCHEYTSPWEAAHIIPDPAVPGLFEFLSQALRVFEVHIFSSRSPAGIPAMKEWFARQLTLQTPLPAVDLDLLKFPVEKPPAKVTLDDRALTFTGAWPDVDYLLDFSPWNREQSTVAQAHRYEEFLAHFQDPDIIAGYLGQAIQAVEENGIEPPFSTKIAMDMLNACFNAGLVAPSTTEHQETIRMAVDASARDMLLKRIEKVRKLDKASPCECHKKTIRELKAQLRRLDAMEQERARGQA